MIISFFVVVFSFELYFFWGGGKGAGCGDRIWDDIESLSLYISPPFQMSKAAPKGWSILILQDIHQSVYDAVYMLLTMYEALDICLI